MKPKTESSELITYERKLSQDLDWALRDASAHFEYGSSVHKSLRKIAVKLDELGIQYAVVGAMAMFAHGYRRFTEDIDMIVAEEDLKEIHESVVGRGYRPVYEGSRHLRDTETGVRIEFLIAGQFPGDGRPKPVSFPQPAEVAVDVDGIQYANLEKLIELKLASGSNSNRLKDLGDVQEMIRYLGLPASIADRLDSSVSDSYLKLWHGLRDAAPDPHE